MNAVKRIGIIALATIALVVILVGLTAIMTGDLRAQEAGPGLMRVPVTCMPFDQLKFDLARAFGEVQAFVGATKAGDALTIFVSRDGTWTAVLLRTGRPACAFTGGEGWSWRAPKEPAS